MNDSHYVIGIDFGTDSVRSIIADTLNGKEVSSRVAYYKRWNEGRFCDPGQNQFRQHPLDYIEGLLESVKGALSELPEDSAQKVVGIGVDTTGSTPAPVDREGNVLALKQGFEENPNAMFILWKDHTSVEEAERINEVAKNWGGIDFTKYVGGVYSSEWFWAKILHTLRNDKKVKKEAYSWVEHADWITAHLTGNLDPLTMKRSRCAAGHKAMWHREWDGLPSEDFLINVDPLLKGLRKKLYTETFTSDKSAGELTKEWAQKLGLKPGIPVAVGSFDAHMGAVGTEIKEKTFVMILGTSACDMAVASPEVVKQKLVEGICGQVDGSIIPGMIGLEAGQSSFGDVYAWFKDILSWPLEMLTESKYTEKVVSEKIIKDVEDRITNRLAEEAEKIDTVENWPLAIDWLNGRRTPWADQRMKGAITGLTLGTNSAKIFKALVESTAYGARAIVERFQEEGIEIEEVSGSGGIPKKNPFVMQVLSNVLGMPVKVARADQAGALGAAMFASVVAGIYPSVEEAQKRMGQGFIKTYSPKPDKTKAYEKVYRNYKNIGAELEKYFREV